MKEVTVPSFGSGVHDVTLNKWFVREGDAVNRGQDMVEVTTEEKSFKIGSPASGNVSELFFEEGDDVEVGEVIATIEGT